jgi:hypothetical protein
MRRSLKRLNSAGETSANKERAHLIAEALKRHEGDKPILILTHTNAGVVALHGRLDRADVPSKAYRLFTIDGWAMRLMTTPRVGIIVRRR